MKTCNACGTAKPLEEFYHDRQAKDGLYGTCKPCAKARARGNYRANPERRRESIYAWQRANPERKREYGRRLYWRTLDYQRERSRRYLEANRDRWRGYASTRRAQQGTASTPEIQALIERLVYGPCTYCGATENIEIDHIVPLSRGGRHEPENLTPACRPCNRSKGSKLLYEWVAL